MPQWTGRPTVPARRPFLQGPHPLAMAHRGGSLLWPENTMVSFWGAVEMGYRYLETDLHTTRDGVLVLIHDDTLERVSDGSGFGFTDNIAAPNSFSLDDGGTKTFSNVFPDTYTVIEDDPEVTPGGFVLSGLSCADPDGGSGVDLGARKATIDLDAGETVTCTFTNSAATPTPTPTNTPTPTETPTVTPTATPVCTDREGDTACDDPINDSDDDGCASWEEQAGAPFPKPGNTGAFDPNAWYDFYDVPVPAKDDAVDGIGPDDPVGANGTRNRAVTMGDVLAVLKYVGTHAADGGAPNPNGVAYDIVKGVDLDGDTTDDAPYSHGIQEGVKYDRSPGPLPDPPADAGPPNGAVTMGDVLAVLAQVGLACTG